MKYKVGDRVRIIDKEEMRNIYSDLSVLKSYFKYCGKVMTIKGVKAFDKVIQYYLMEEDGETLAWSEKMIEGLVFDDNESSSGHFIKGKNDIYTLNW